MARIVIVGAGFAGQTAALYLGHRLARDHQVTMINASDQFYFIPSFVWVGTGRMAPHRTHFPLAGVYKRFGIRLEVGRAVEVNPVSGWVRVERHDAPDLRVEYDQLLLATGPRLNFDATPGLGPGRHSQSICTLSHAVEASHAYLEEVARLERGERRRFLIGTGHPGATCQGAAFEYICNIHRDLVARRLRDRVDLRWLSNEAELGDFGIQGLEMVKGGTRLSSEQFIGAAFRDMGVSWQVRTGVTGLDAGVAHWRDYEDHEGETPFDFAMLIPQFTGVPLKVSGDAGEDLSSTLLNPAGFVLVDGIYGLPWSELAQRPEAWPAQYQNPTWRNIHAAGIAFAPPGPISRPHVTPGGFSITAAPPRTGMVSGIIGRLVALNIADKLQTGHSPHSERMSEMAAACIASMGDSLWDGSAATILIHPVVPDHRKFPDSGGRDPFVTHMEMGLAGAWMKRLIHSTFMHKLQGRPGWRLIPE
ncbi:MAG: FAD-dependent oxidoreductase [Candidatus Cloacimonetes bacterium]|nr:FAD-dependent oxidoreductase [Candidatus Cloacimonadota bacterium]